MWRFLFQNLISRARILVSLPEWHESQQWVGTYGIGFWPICLSIATLWKLQLPHGYCSKLFTGLLCGRLPYRSFGSGATSLCLPIASCSALGQACLHTICICLWCSGEKFLPGEHVTGLLGILPGMSFLSHFFFTPCRVQVSTYYPDFRFPYEDFHFGGLSKRIQHFHSRVVWSLPNNSLTHSHMNLRMLLH